MEVVNLSNHVVRKALMLSLNEMAVLCNIKKLSQSPDFGFWCVKSKDKMAEWLDLSRATIFNSIKTLEEKGYIVKSEVGLRPSKFIYDLDLAEEEIAIYIKTNNVELISAKMHEILALDGQSKFYTTDSLNFRRSQSKNWTLNNNIDIIENNKEKIIKKEIENSELSLFNEALKVAVNTKKEIGGAGDVPNLQEFVDYSAQLVDKSFNRKLSQTEKFAIEQKYQAWLDNGWKDGHDSKIKNWRSKLGNTLKFLLDGKGTGSNKQTNFSGQGGKSTGIVTEADYFNYLVNGKENTGGDGQGVLRTLELPDSNDGS